MDNEKDLLIASAARLYSMGIDLEAARDRLRQLVEQGVPYNSDEMKQAVQDFKELSATVLLGILFWYTLARVNSGLQKLSEAITDLKTTIKESEARHEHEYDKD